MTHFFYLGGILIMIIKSPCYDEDLEQECPAKCSGCHATCDDYKKYKLKKLYFTTKLNKLKRQAYDQWVPHKHR